MIPDRDLYLRGVVNGECAGLGLAAGLVGIADGRWWLVGIGAAMVTTSWVRRFRFLRSQRTPDQ